MEGPRVESAFISGEKAADLMFNRTKSLTFTKFYIIV